MNNRRVGNMVWSWCLFMIWLAMVGIGQELGRIATALEKLAK